MLCLKTNETAEAVKLFRRALTLGADSNECNFRLALALLARQRPAEALRCCEQALALRPGDRDMLSAKAKALLSLGRVAEGFAAWHASWETDRRVLALTWKPFWDGQPLCGETVLIHTTANGDLGYGDIIQFVRCVPKLVTVGARVLLRVPPSMKRLLCLPGVVTCSEDELTPAHDFWCTHMSLPCAFGTTLDNIPFCAGYLRGDASRWDDFLTGLPGVKVGLCWSGAQYGPHGPGAPSWRSMRLADMAPLFTVPGCSFVSLQLGPPASELAKRDRCVVHDVSARLGDWQDTADLISGLDLVITVDTAVAHLAGALGRPVWLLNRYDTCWRSMLDREDSPWYSSMRIFRQATPGDWASVIQRVRKAMV